MSTTPRIIGTLVVVILKAQHLPNKRHIGKQDPYCRVSFNNQALRTRAIKRGGQHPEWDEEVRFTLYEDPDDVAERPASGHGSPPPPPPKGKDGKKKKSIKGGNSMMVACYADDPKEPELIGETVVDLTEVLTRGETDEWFTLTNKEKFSGEVYLELTFWSNEKPPEKKPVADATKMNDRYGGPGSFVPADGGSPAGRDNIPVALRTSSSLAKLDLYVPPYNPDGTVIRRHRSDVDQVTDEFGALGFNTPRRRESYPPPQLGHSRPHSDDQYSQYSTSSWTNSAYHPPIDAPAQSSWNTWPQNSSGEIRHGMPYEANSHPQYGFHSQPSAFHHQQDYSATQYNIPASSSGFAPVSSTPAPSGFASYPHQTPIPSSFVSQGVQFPSVSGYGPAPSHTPAPSGFVPPPSSMGYHTNPSPTAMQGYPYHSYPPQQSSAPNLAYPPPTPQPSVPPVSHSAPPQQYPEVPSPTHTAVPPVQYQNGSHQTYLGGPSPVHAVSQQSYQTAPPPMQGVPQQYPTYGGGTPSPPQVTQPQQPAYNPSPPLHGSRPLPQPGQTPAPYPLQSTGSNPPTPSRSDNTIYTNTPPRAALPNPPVQQSQSQSYTNGFVPPPPPPLINHRMSIPPPPPPQLRQGSSPENQSPYGHPVTRRSSLPIPPTGNIGKPPLPPPPPALQSGQQFMPPPPPPSALQPVYENSSHPLPQVPQPSNSASSIQVGQIYPGPPPRPPVMQAYGGPY